MRKLFSAAVLTAVLATPAMAQSGRAHHAQHGATLPWDAVNGVDGYAGQDPDPNVRLELRRDFYRE